MRSKRLSEGMEGRTVNTFISVIISEELVKSNDANIGYEERVENERSCWGINGERKRKRDRDKERQSRRDVVVMESDGAGLNQEVNGRRKKEERC